MELHVLALLQCLYTCTYCLLVTYEVFVVPKQMNSTVCHQWHYWLVTSPVCCCSATVLFPREITAVAATHMFHLMFNRRSKKEQSITKKSRYKEMYGFQSEKIPKQISEQIHIVSSHQQSADRQRRFHFTASFRIIIRTRPSTLFPHHFSCFHMGES